jgi:hypothetical protein
LESMPDTLAHRLDHVQVEAPDEDRQPAEEGALRLREQTVAPVQRRPQRLLTRQRATIAPGQEPKAVV